MKATGLCFFAFLAAPALFAGEGAAVLKAGGAREDITPPPGLPLWGYGARKDLPAKGAHDPLWATGVVLEAEGQKLALVGLDLGRSPARRSMAWIRERVLKEAGVQTVFIVGSHTHHGPCLELEGVPPTSEYIQSLNERIAGLIVRAARAAAPARIGAAGADVDLNRNRHTKIEPKPVDRELAVIRIDGADGRPIATIVNFAAHPTTREAEMLQYSSDYVGPLRAAFEKEAGGVCVFLQGAAGDLSTERRGKDTEAYGDALGEEALKLWRSIVPAAPAKPSLQVREEEFKFASRVDHKDPMVYLAFSVAFFKTLVDAYLEEYRDGIRPHLTVALLDGEIGLVGASGEFFASHSIRLKQRARLPHVLFLGYANGYHQYFPTIEAAAEGGYGADPEVSPVEVGAGERMLDRALFHLYDMRKAFKSGIGRR